MIRLVLMTTLALAMSLALPAATHSFSATRAERAEFRPRAGTQRTGRVGTRRRGGGAFRVILENEACHITLPLAGG